MSLESEGKRRFALPFRWHALMLFSCIGPVSILISIGDVEYADEDNPWIHFSLVMVWMGVLLLWIPAMFHIVSKCGLRDILLTALYPVLSFVILMLASSAGNTEGVDELLGAMSQGM